MGKHFPVKGMRGEQQIDDVYAVKSKRTGVLSYSKGYRFEITVGDASGSIPVKYWGGKDERQVKQLLDSLDEGAVVHVKGKASEYNERLEVSVDTEGVLKRVDASLVAPDTFIAHSNRDIESEWLRLRSVMDSIQDRTLRAVLDGAFSSLDVINKFKKAPCSKSIHHDRIGGLLEHTADLLALCEHACKVYPFLDKELLFAGAILQDYGKLEEYVIEGAIQTTPVLPLVGHLTVEAGRILSFRGKPGIDDNKLLKLCHLIVSHHGKEEFGSPKQPAFPEALVLSEFDMLDAKLDRMRKLMQEAEGSKEVYDKLDDRTIYLG